MASSKRNKPAGQKLETFIGLGVDPEKDVELGDLLKATGKYSVFGLSSEYVLTIIVVPP